MNRALEIFNEARRSKVVDQGDEGDSNIIFQLRKAVTLRGLHKVKFGDGRSHAVQVAHARRALSTHDEFRDPKKKLAFMGTIGQSHQALCHAIGEEYIEEVSKKTLGSYVKKASHAAYNAAGDAIAADDQGEDPSDADRRANNHLRGIERASDRLSGAKKFKRKKLREELVVEGEKTFHSKRSSWEDHADEAGHTVTKHKHPDGGGYNIHRAHDKDGKLKGEYDEKAEKHSASPGWIREETLDEALSKDPKHVQIRDEHKALMAKEKHQVESEYKRHHRVSDTRGVSKGDMAFRILHARHGVKHVEAAFENKKAVKEATLDELSAGKLVDYSVRARGDMIKHDHARRVKRNNGMDDDAEKHAAVVRKRAAGDRRAGAKLDKKYQTETDDSKTKKLKVGQKDKIEKVDMDPKLVESDEKAPEKKKGMHPAVSAFLRQKARERKQNG